MRLEGWRLARRLDVLTWVQRKEPVIVFQMGKVGSTSVGSSFPTSGHPVAVQTHHLYRPRISAVLEWNAERGLPSRAHYFHADAVARRVVERDKPYKLITLVREPVGRSVSNFFHNFERFVGVPLDESTHSVDALVEILVANEKQLDESKWYRREFEPAVGVDVYDHPFPHDDHSQVIRSGAGKILILRLETPDDEKERAIAGFLGEPSFSLNSANVGESKAYGEGYVRFQSEAVLPADFLERKLSTVYATHFYSAEEREAVRERWSRASRT